MQLHSMELDSKQNISLPILEFYLKGSNTQLANNPLASCSLINFDFLAPHIAHFDNIIVLPLLVFAITGSVLCVFFCTLDDKIALFYI